MFLTLSGTGMDLNHIERVMNPDIPTSAEPLGFPVKFATWRDPLNRFELGYPQAWRLDAGTAVAVNSNRLASFARVDLFPGPELPWTDFQAALAGMGGALTILKATPERLHGILEIGGKRFELRARAFLRSDETIVLTTGADAVPGPFQNYENQVLAAIRRVFKIL
jgi:hypothetical protein